MLSTSRLFAANWNRDMPGSSAETRWQKGGMLGQCNRNTEPIQHQPASNLSTEKATTSNAKAMQYQRGLAGFKIQCPQGRVGSSPTFGTN